MATARKTAAKKPAAKSAAPKRTAASKTAPAPTAGSAGASHWLIKSEPSVYGFADLQRDGRTRWDGVRSFEARNNLKAMSKGDLLLFYHSNEGKAVVGVARVRQTAFPDPTADEAKGNTNPWVAVEVEPLTPLTEPVTLEALRQHPETSAMAVVKKSRLSVSPVTSAEFESILRISKTRMP